MEDGKSPEMQAWMKAKATYAAYQLKKQPLRDELQWREFEALLAVVAPAYNTPAHEYAEIREIAAGDLLAAIACYLSLAQEILDGNAR